MAVPISIIPRKKVIGPSGLSALVAITRHNLFLVLGVAALLAVGIAYSSLYVISQRDQKRLDDAKSFYLQLVDPQTVEQNLEAREFAGRANQLKSLLESHHQTSRIFTLIESSLHPLVVLDAMEFSYDTSQVKVGGNTDGYKTLAEQLVLWNATKNITSVRLENFKLSTDGRLNFSAILQTPPSLTISTQ